MMNRLLPLFAALALLAATLPASAARRKAPPAAAEPAAELPAAEVPVSADADLVPDPVEEPAPAAEPASTLPPWIRPVADVRLRLEAFDAIPLRTGAYSRGGENTYFRFRSRLGFLLGPDSPLSLNVRLLHEFRAVMRPVHSHSWRWPDELVLDALALSWHTRDGNLALTAGRQDLAIPSSLHYLGDGTPKDGSRSSYMTAVAATLQTPSRRTRLDAFAAYDPDEDPLAIGHLHRDLDGYTPNDTGMDEAGAGAFLRQLLSSVSPATTNPVSLTALYLWKHDSHWRAPAKPDVPDTRRPSEDIHTAGLLLAVPLDDTLTASAEVARQFSPSSDADRRAWLAETALARTFPALPGAALALRLLYLSGDDPSTARAESWNPLWARYPWFSELMLYGYDADPAPWQNLLAPTLEARLPGLAARHALRATLSYLHAPEADTVTDSHDRGWLATARYEFPVLPTFARDTLRAHVQVEALTPGDYYPGPHNPAYFLRLELVWAL